MKETRLTCPCCGAEFKIAERQHAAVGTAIGEDSGLGTIQMPLKKPGTGRTAEERLAALKAAGFDTTGLFALKDAAGEEHIVRMDAASGKLEFKDDDPVLRSILESGTIPERRLFRRWVTAQMFRLLGDGFGYERTVRRRGPSYMWKMAVEEYRVQAILQKKDPDAFRERNLWFNRAVAVKMVRHYIDQLEKKAKRQSEIEHGSPTRSGEKLIHFAPKKTERINSVAYRIPKAKDAAAIHRLLKTFSESRFTFKNETVCQAWYDAFRGAGAYFTLKNLILFHGITFHGHKGEEAADCLFRRAEYLVRCGHSYKMFGEMLETLRKNSIDVKAMRAQWAAAKAAAVMTK